MASFYCYILHFIAKKVDYFFIYLLLFFSSWFKMLGPYQKPIFLSVVRSFPYLFMRSLYIINLLYIVNVFLHVPSNFIHIYFLIQWGYTPSYLSIFPFVVSFLVYCLSSPPFTQVKVTITRDSRRLYDGRLLPFPVKWSLPMFPNHSLGNK